MTDQLPQPKTMMAFVAVPPPVPPPPPPPAPARPQQAVPKLVSTSGIAAPVEPPAAITPEHAPPDLDEEGVVGGVEGGIPGGIIGGIVGAIETEIPLPPALPAPSPLAPIRIGGAIREPALVYRVNPVYPLAAVKAGLEGVVILEAIVDREGRVEDVKVLRSQGIFDRPAIDAVRQWRYSPVLLNGRPEKFILTVVVTFRLED